MISRYFTVCNSADRSSHAFIRRRIGYLPTDLIPDKADSMIFNISGAAGT